MIKEDDLEVNLEAVAEATFNVKFVTSSSMMPLSIITNSNMSKCHLQILTTCLQLL